MLESAVFYIVFVGLRVISAELGDLRYVKAGKTCSLDPRRQRGGLRGWRPFSRLASQLTLWRG